MSTALTHTTVAMTCLMLGGVGDQLTAPLSPGATQTSTSCSTMSCLSRPGKAWGSGEKGIARFGGNVWGVGEYGWSLGKNRFWGAYTPAVVGTFLTGPLPSRLGSIAEIDLGVPPPIMKSFKEFLLSLDDSVDETEAVKRYNDYKLDFRRQQMQDFFLAHKDEEW